MALHHAATVAHCESVTKLAEAIATRLGLDDRERELVAWAALVHDLGKLAIPRAVLDKPAGLTEEEWEAVREQPDRGADFLERVDGLALLAPAVRASHERWDGSGYPKGLRQDQIPLAARIVAACDAFDAMTTERPYRAARPLADAVAELQTCAGTQFDPAVIAALVEELAALLLPDLTGPRESVPGEHFDAQDDQQAVVLLGPPPPGPGD
jgi:putative nucleotidyltransferase with HDIG domain